MVDLLNYAKLQLMCLLLNNKLVKIPKMIVVLYLNIKKETLYLSLEDWF